MEMRKYLEEITDQIRCKKAHSMIVDELSQHITTQKEDYMAAGVEEKEAEVQAVAQMGDPVEVGMQLDRIHRPQLEWKMLIIVLVLSIVGAILQYLIQKPTSQADAYSIENYIMWMVLGLIMMAGIYFIDYTIIGKYSLRLYWGYLGASAAFLFARTLIDGIDLKMYALSGLFVPIYAGILYRNRNQGNKGLIKSILYLMPPLLVMQTVLFSAYLQTITICFCMLNIAVWKKWFGSHRRWKLIGMWGVFAGAPLIFMAAVRGVQLAPYQLARLASVFNGSSYQFFEAKSEFTSLVAEAAKGSGALLESGVMNIDEIQSYYMVLFLFRYLGNLWGCLIMLLFTVLFYKAFRISLRQKNSLGYIVAVSCSLLLFKQAALYIVCNFGLLPPAIGTMPFLSYGGANTCVTYILIGLLLSVYRNTHVVSEPLINS